MVGNRGFYCRYILLQLQEQELNEIVALIVQYLPYLTITVLNFAVPIVFEKLVQLEDYSPTFALRLTLARWVLGFEQRKVISPLESDFSVKSHVSMEIFYYFAFATILCVCVEGSAYFIHRSFCSSTIILFYL